MILHSRLRTIANEDGYVYVVTWAQPVSSTTNEPIAMLGVFEHQADADGYALMGSGDANLPESKVIKVKATILV